VASGGDSGFVRISKASNGETIVELAGHTGAISHIAWHPDGRLLVSTSFDGTARIWDVDEAATVRTISNPSREAINSACWLPPGMRLVLGTSAGSLIQTGAGANAGQQVLDDFASSGAVLSVVASQSGSKPLVAAVHLDGTIVVYSADGKLTRIILQANSSILEDGEKLSQIPKGVPVTPTFLENAIDLGLHPDGRTLAIVNGDICLWEIGSRGTKELNRHDVSLPLRTIPGKEAADDGYRTVAWSPNGDYLASGDGTGVVNIWKTDRWQICASYTCGGRVNALAWRPGDGQQLAVASDDHAVHLFDLRPPTERQTLDPETAFSVADVMTIADQFLDEEDDFPLRRAVDLLMMYRVSSRTAESLQRYDRRLREAARTLLKETLDAWDESAPQATPQPPPTATRPTARAPRASRSRSRSASAAPGAASPRNGPAETAAAAQAAADEAAESARQRTIDHILALHEVIQLDPNGPSGKQARKRLIDLSKPRRTRRR